MNKKGCKGESSLHLWDMVMPRLKKNSKKNQSQ